MFKKIKAFFTTKEPEKVSTKREIRELLRENLRCIAVDVFHYDDPIMKFNPAERLEYLAYFHVLVTEGKIIERLEYLINKQANVLLKNGTAENGELDMTAMMTMNGLTSFKNDLEKLSGMYLQEKNEQEATIEYNKSGL